MPNADASPRYDVIAIGNAVVDVIAPCEEELIDELGLKGTRVGGAIVSDVHGNFIVNDGGATAADVLNLIELVRERVRSQRGIELETEVEILGEG